MSTDADRIKFTCPTCGAQHDRGYVDGVETFRCLRCGYVGFGHHPNPEIDTEVQADAKAARAWDRAHGIGGDS